MQPEAASATRRPPRPRSWRGFMRGLLLRAEHRVRDPRGGVGELLRRFAGRDHGELAAEMDRKLRNGRNPQAQAEVVARIADVLGPGASDLERRETDERIELEPVSAERQQGVG